ncbi:DUF421 domain-containing protein [Pontibacter sp. HSC-14F20]|uniref:DUF421 domain-containing protein n=1 Tax=Pontibacter sp. HSC-14F20 TaxID=2864136 RepID=UPI001C732CC3|nr:YetF domain-containing protein [Pontibacter sp. HSC-14F20]MBX0332409.1 DUF421 domain-containing protein [Pontibacter sp. HSC-14F20]
MENIFFDGWGSIIRTLSVTIMGYIAMIVLLRASGKRTLSKMNAFDFVVTVALGSVLASLSLNKNVSLADGITSFFVLIFLQYLITWLSVRIRQVKQVITSQPTLLLYKGELLEGALKRERITIEEINSAARNGGQENLSVIDAMILESTGDITVIPTLKSDTPNTLKEASNFPG